MHEQTGHIATELKPLGDRVLVEPVEEENTKKSGILIPDTAKAKPTEAIARALGTGKTNAEGKRIPFDVKVGDQVLTSRYVGTEVQLDKKEYRILSLGTFSGLLAEPRSQSPEGLMYGCKTTLV